MLTGAADQFESSGMAGALTNEQFNHWEKFITETQEMAQEFNPGLERSHDLAQATSRALLGLEDLWGERDSHKSREIIQRYREEQAQ